MVISSNTFQSELSQRLDGLRDYIENLLAPLMGIGSKVRRSQMLWGIIDNAAKLALECEQQPSKFGLDWYGFGYHCKRDEMSDALGEVADNKLASSGAYVSLTVSPMVVRDGETVLVKARVLRELPPADRHFRKHSTSEQLESSTEVAFEDHDHRR